MMDFPYDMMERRKHTSETSSGVDIDVIHVIVRCRCVFNKARSHPEVHFATPPAHFDGRQAALAASTQHLPIRRQCTPYRSLFLQFPCCRVGPTYKTQVVPRIEHSFCC